MNTPCQFLHCLLVKSLLGLAVVSVAPGALEAALGDSPPPATASSFSPHADRLPRKVLIGTMVCDPGVDTVPLEERIKRMDELASEVATGAAAQYPGKRLDLMVFPEFFMSRPGGTLAQKCLHLEEVFPRISSCAVRYDCYLIMPVLMVEADAPTRYSNAAVIIDRAGHLAGIYRKVHPVAPQGSDLLEDGTTPGASYPTFDCDFGRIGIQICFDMLYPEGWQALAKQGAELVVLPSASAETVRPSVYAFEHHYYVVSATPKFNASVYSPLGLIEAQVTRPSVLVHEIDLSYAILHWEAVLEDGALLKRAFGDRVGFHYYTPEDNGIFWSNDPKMTIGEMLRSVQLTDSGQNVERVRKLEDAARGGRPLTP